ncbi:MAG: hypothetical protein U0T83_10265 [Bacteriovoracaceae bacterium]
MKPIPLVLILLASFFFASTLFASVSMKRCPDRFIGKVTEVSDINSVDTDLAKVEVTFASVNIMAGTVEEFPKFTALKYNQMQFLLGEKYMIESNKNKICTIQKM